jgi:hypothetical protein
MISAMMSRDGVREEIAAERYSEKDLLGGLETNWLCQVFYRLCELEGRIGAI